MRKSKRNYDRTTNLKTEGFVKMSNPLHNSFKSQITYYLLTESEVITGESQTEALMY